MFDIYICEDDAKQLENLRTMIANYILFHENTYQIQLATQNPQELLDYVRDNQVKQGIYFLDIDLNHRLNGIDVAERIREYDCTGKMTFITTHEEMAPLTLRRKIETFDFIEKSDLHTMNQRIFDNLEAVYNRLKTAHEEQNTSIQFKIGSSVYHYNIADILFIETSGAPHRLTIHSKKGQYDFYGRIKDYDEMYEDLIRVSHSTLVNRNNVKKVDYAQRMLYFSEYVSTYFSSRNKQKIKEYFGSDAYW